MFRSVRSRHRIPLVHGAWLLLLALGACNASSDSSGAERDAAADAADDVDAVSPNACAHSVADACGAGCPMEWPSDIIGYCAAHTPSASSDSLAVDEDCGEYRGLRVNGVDAGVSYYFDVATGKLVAFVSRFYSLETTKCLGGPADFVEPNCNWATVDCSDAGVPGTGGAAGNGGVAGAAGSP